ncbi:hypothetical protein GCM10025777_15020 [Membranihabitans marinus]
MVSGLYFQNKGGENGEKYPDFRAYFKYQYYQVSIPLTTYYNLGRKFTVFMGIYGGRNLPYKLYYHINNTRARFIDDRSEGEFYVDKSIRKFEWGSKFGIEFRAFKNTLTNTPPKTLYNNTLHLLHAKYSDNNRIIIF